MDSQTPDQSGASPPLSESVRRALEDLTQQEVAALDIVKKIAAAHPEYVRKRVADLVPAPPAGAVRQAATRWETELAPLVAPNQRIFGRLAIVLFCLLDASSASLAEGSGLLWQVAVEVSPFLPTMLSERGEDLLRQHSRLLAAALGLVPPTLTLQGLTGQQPLLALAAQDVSSDTVAEWAASDGDAVFRGDQHQSPKVLDGVAVTGLRWSQRDVLLVAHDKGLTELRDDRARHHPAWGSVQELAVSDGLALVVRNGQFLSGIPDDEPVLDEHQEASVEHVAGWPGNHWVFTAGSSLHAYNPEHANGPERGWTVMSATTHRITALAAGRDGDVALGCANGSLVFLRPSDGTSAASMSAQIPSTSEPVTLLDAGPAGLAASAEGAVVAVWRAGQEIARITHPAPIRALSLSPDGFALGTIDAGGELRIWRIDSASAFRLTSYTPDSVYGEDLLGISGTVDALAALVSARVVQPPLSIGLFGSWGAGKTFFLRQLHRRVAELSEAGLQSGRRQQDLWAWRNVSQVWFNAWNYASADVWAGLVDHLLRELTRTTVPKDALPPAMEYRRQQRLARLTDAQQSYKVAESELGKAKEEHQKAQNALSEAQTRLKNAEEHVEEQARRVVADASFTESRKVVQKAVNDVGLAPIGDTLADLQGALAEANHVLLSGRSLLRSPQTRRLVLVAIAVPLFALLVGLLVHKVTPSLTGLTSIATGLTTALGIAAAWLRRSTDWVQARLRDVQEAEEKLRNEMGHRKDELAKAQNELDDSGKDVAKREQDLRSKQDAVAAAQTEVAADTAASLLGEYLADRAASADYRRQLGLIGTVRDDLETISQAVSVHNVDLVDPVKRSPNDDAVNRVVLYIDDLDRCPPRVVVNVLEAVSLLLSYPLFVVVVAVDARWVSRALATIYPEMLATEEVTPEDYLEKIFQLPVWLDPLESRAARGMIEALLAAGEVGLSTHTIQGRNDTPEPPKPGLLSPTSDQETGDASTYPGSQPQYLATSPPSTLQVSVSEQETLKALAPLLTRSPRALKRYLNTYRLLKGSVQDPHQLEISQVLLAVCCGRPQAGEALLRVLESNDGGDTLRDAVDRLSETDREWLAGALPPERVNLSWWSRGEARALVPYIRRYVFRTAPMVRARKRRSSSRVSRSSTSAPALQPHPRIAPDGGAWPARVADQSADATER